MAGRKRTYLRVVLEKGFFPKELPPGFSTTDFAGYANSNGVKRMIDEEIARLRKANKKGLNWPAVSTPVVHNLPLSSYRNRRLSIVNPFGYATLVRITQKNRPRLGKLSSSGHNLSWPYFSDKRSRSITPAKSFGEDFRLRRIALRAGCTHVASLDVAHFYDNLYTHALAWAISPKAKGVHSSKNLPGLVDKALRNLKDAQTVGIPVGPDISLLLSEIVLCRVDKALEKAGYRLVRWFDDIEVICGSANDCEQAIADAAAELRQYRLELSPSKSHVHPLPSPLVPSWKDKLTKYKFTSKIVNLADFFELAFSLQLAYPGDQVLTYAVGRAFDLLSMAISSDTFDVLVQLLTQCMTSEPACCPKAISLIVGARHFNLLADEKLLQRTVEILIQQATRRGSAVDAAWALHLCIVTGVSLNKKTAKLLRDTEDDVVLVLSMDLESRGQMPDVGIRKKCQKWLVKDCLWKSGHWLVLYEGVRHGWVQDTSGILASDPPFQSLLTRGVRFYDSSALTPFATLMHPMGAPGNVKQKLRQLVEQIQASTSAQAPATAPGPMTEVAKKIAELNRPQSSPGENGLARFLQSLGDISPRNEWDEDDSDYY